jgi:hypothetical protein
MTAQGHARSTFRRGIERGNLLVEETTAREIGHISLGEALSLTLLIARRAPDRPERFSSRWLQLDLAECADVTTRDFAFVTASLAALADPLTHEPAAGALVALARRSVPR